MGRSATASALKRLHVEVRAQISIDQRPIDPRLQYKQLTANAQIQDEMFVAGEPQFFELKKPAC